MNRSALLTLPALLLAACSYTGQHQAPSHGPAFAPGYGYGQSHTAWQGYGQGHAAPHHAAPVQNACAYGGPCLQGGYSTHGAQRVTHAAPYGTPVQGRPFPAGHGLRGYSDPYARRGYAYGTLGAQWFDVDTDFAGVQGRLGYTQHRGFGAEVEGSLGVTEDNVDAIAVSVAGPGATADAKVDNQVAAFGTYRFPLSQRFALKPRIGYHRTQIGVDVALNGQTGSDSGSFDGLAYGLGAEYDLSPRDAIRADYTAYAVDTDDIGYDSVSVAYLRRF